MFLVRTNKDIKDGERNSMHGTGLGRVPMNRLMTRLQAYEKEKETKVKCPVSKFPCARCPVTYVGTCGKLDRFLDNGRWD